MPNQITNLEYAMTVRAVDDKVTADRLIRWFEDVCGKWARDWNLVVERNKGFRVLTRTEHQAEMFCNRWANLVELEKHYSKASEKHVDNTPNKSAHDQPKVETKQEASETISSDSNRRQQHPDKK